MNANFEIFNPTIITLSIFTLGAIALFLTCLVFILAWLYWRALEKPVQQSFKHYLTNLPNRKEFTTTLDRLLKSNKKNEVNVALLFVDIDAFNSINNSLGNKIGDELLLHLSKAIERIAYKYTKYLYQIGSDEFAIVLSDCGTDQNLIAEFAKDINHAVAQPVNIEGYELHCSCGIGICIYPECAMDADSLLKNASAAKDNAKKIGYGAYSFYTKEMSKKSVMRTLITGDLRAALPRNEFYLQYQPLINIIDGRVAGVEALLRWHHPSLGNVTPDIFIPVIEDLGLIHSIGKWVIFTACKDVVKLHAGGYPDLAVAINISAHQFNKGDIATVVAEAIFETGIAPQKVEIELTESVVMSDIEKSILMFKVLRSMGVKLAVDDFGTGYSSMNQLNRFPISILKIDRSFIHNVNENQANVAIVSTMIRMGKQLGYTVVGEGVETKEELAFLRKEGCDLVQGFYYSKPLSLAELNHFLQERGVGVGVHIDKA